MVDENTFLGLLTDLKNYFAAGWRTLGSWSLVYFPKNFEVMNEPLDRPASKDIAAGTTVPVWSTERDEHGYILGLRFRADSRDLSVEVTVDNKRKYYFDPVTLELYGQTAPNGVWPYLTARSPMATINDDEVCIMFSPSVPYPYERKILVKATNGSKVKTVSILDGEIVRMVMSP